MPRDYVGLAISAAGLRSTPETDEPITVAGEKRILIMIAAGVEPTPKSVQPGCAAGDKRTPKSGQRFKPDVKPASGALLIH